MISKKTEVKVSKFMSLVLRHDPAAGGITLNAEGWVNASDLLKSVREHVSPDVHMDEMLGVIHDNDKQRFAIMETTHGILIRANQGHSIEVDLNLSDAVPTGVLYHGTSTRFYGDIIKDGLKKMSRHAVHLSADTGTAAKVGQRHGGNLIIFTVDTAAMIADGHVFQRSDNGVWLTDQVPSKYLSVYSG